MNENGLLLEKILKIIPFFAFSRILSYLRGAYIHNALFFASMEDIPVGFIFILLGFFAAAIALTVIAIAWKQRKIQRLKNPHKDYYRRKV